MGERAGGVIVIADGTKGGEEGGEAKHGEDEGDTDGGEHELAKLGQEEDGGREEEQARATGGHGAAGDRDAKRRDRVERARLAVDSDSPRIHVRDAEVHRVVHRKADEDCDADRLEDVHLPSRQVRLAGVKRGAHAARGERVEGRGKGVTCQPYRWMSPQSVKTMQTIVTVARAAIVASRVKRRSTRNASPVDALTDVHAMERACASGRASSESDATAIAPRAARANADKYESQLDAPRTHRAVA